MSRLLGISTTEFLERYAANGGTTLRSDAASRCVFVTESGCAVHPRRPLVCRLYPLGRAVDGAGEERFAVFPKQEGCEAELATAGTVAGFLEAQGVAPYFEWSDRYGRLYHRMLGLLDRMGVDGKIEVGADRAEEDGTEAEETGSAEADASPISAWQDIDASLAEYCSAKGIAAPAGVAEAIEMHLAAMREWLDGLEAGLEAPTEGPEKGNEP